MPSADLTLVDQPSSVAQWLEHPPRKWKVPGSNPGWVNTFRSLAWVDWLVALKQWYDSVSHPSRRPAGPPRSKIICQGSTPDCIPASLVLMVVFEGHFNPT